MPARQQVFDSKRFIACLCQGNNFSSIRIGFFLSCFSFPDFFVKSANRDANIPHSDLHSTQLDLCSCCIITEMNHCCLSSVTWQDGEFSPGKYQPNPAPTALMTPTAYFVFIAEKKHPVEKGSALNFALCQDKHGSK